MSHQLPDEQLRRRGGVIPMSSGVLPAKRTLASSWTGDGLRLKQDGSTGMEDGIMGSSTLSWMRWRLTGNDPKRAGKLSDSGGSHAGSTSPTQSTAHPIAARKTSPRVDHLRHIIFGAKMLKQRERTGRTTRHSCLRLLRN